MTLVAKDRLVESLKLIALLLHLASPANDPTASLGQVSPYENLGVGNCLDANGNYYAYLG